MARNLKGKNNQLIIAAIAFVVVVILLIAFFPKAEQEEAAGPQVITKRVKLNLIDETVNVGENHLKEGEAEKAASAPEEPAHAAAAPQNAPEPEPAAEAEMKEPEKKAAPVKKTETGKPAASQTRTASVSKLTLAANKPWAINVASFPNGEGARKLERSLDAAGYNAYTTKFTKDGINWTRVRVGFYASKDDAKKAGDSIKRQYKVQSPWIVLPTKEETIQHIK